MRARTISSVVVLVLGGLLVAASLLVLHMNREVFDGGAFANHVDNVRRDDDVAELLGREISHQIIVSSPDLAALRPLLDSVSVSVAGSGQLSGATRTAARSLHEALVDGGSDALILRITDAGSVVAAVISVVAPESGAGAAQISVTLATFGGDGFSDALVDVAQSARTLAWALPLAALVCFAAAIALSPRRWPAAANVGRTLLWTAAGVGLTLIIGGYVIRRVDASTLRGAVLRAGWDEFVQPLWWSVIVTAIAGLVLVFACDSSGPAAVAERTRRWWRASSRTPATVTGRVIRLVVAAVVGVAAMLDPNGLVELAVVLAGVGLVLFAIIEFAAITATHRDQSNAATPAAQSTRRTWRYAVLGGAAAVLIGAIVFQARPGGDVPTSAAELVDTASSTEGLCNGHAALCDRTFDDVAYVASHNAMSVFNAPGWFIPEQTDPIPDQLDQGVRALLIDVWSGRQGGDMVRTAAESYEEALAIAREELGQAPVDAALRFVTSIAGPPSGPERRYLCHGLCEIGATPFVPTLEAIRDWLAANPNEVLTLFIEDHVAANLIGEDVVTAGLEPYIFTPPAVGEPWPTLGEMIGSGHRLVVMVEAGSGGDEYPWLVNGFEHTQDTPYTFPTVDDFSCDANRGPDDAPLFLINHWLSGFGSLVSNADRVNTRDVLLTRSQQCWDERGQIPNFIGINFVDRGDVYEVVDELNGVGANNAADPITAADTSLVESNDGPATTG